MEIIYRHTRFISDSDHSIEAILYIANIRENRLCVFIDGKYQTNLSIDHVVHRHCTVIIFPELSGRTGFKIGASVVLLAASIASAGLGTPAFGASLSGFGLAAARAGILVGGALIATGLSALAPKSLSQVNGQENQESPTFSLSSSGNAFRPYQPLPIIMGQHNIFPDFSSLPYNEFQTYDQSYNYDSVAWVRHSFTEAIPAGGPVTQSFGGDSFTFTYPSGVPSPPSGPDDFWRYVGTTNQFYGSDITAQNSPSPALGDKYRRLYVYVTSSTYSGAINRFVSYEDLRTNGPSATFYNTGLTFSNSQNFEFENIVQGYPRKTEVVKQIMNYGFGDLVFVSSKIGTTTASSYRQYDDTNDGNPLSKTASNWILPQGEPGFSTSVSSGQVISFNRVNGNVNSVDGGRLDNVASFAYPNGNWVTRRGPENTFALQIDIEGRQFRLDKVNGGTAIVSRYFNFQYRRVAPTTTGWIDFERSMTVGDTYSAPYKLTHGSSGDVWRDTVFVDNLSAGTYEVRGQRVDPNEDSQDIVSEIYMKRVRFYQLDESQNYVAQNRVGIIVESDSQLNGSLNRISSVVSAKCWENNGDNTYDWAQSSNPADWFLFYCRGGFKNTSATGSFTYPYSPTVGWVNSADHPDNGERLFGAGISDSAIDLDALTSWWNYCDSNDIRFDAVIDRSENVYDTIKKICAVGRASPTWATGKIGVVFEDPDQLAVAMFTPENILKDSFEISYITEDLPDEFIVNFVNRNNNWQQESVRAQAIGVTQPVNTQTVDFFGVTIEDQAQREANRLAARQTYNRRICKFSTDGEGLIVTRGDVIYVSHDLFNWDYSSRVVSMKKYLGNIYQIEMTNEISDTITHVSIRIPRGDIDQYACTVTGNIIQLTDLMPSELGPQYLDQNNTVNEDTEFPESVPEDYLIIAGNRTKPGRKMRITGVTCKSENEFEIACIEEDPGFYAQEYALSGMPVPENYERVKASVTKASFILKSEGRAILYWETDGAYGVSIMLTLNGGVPFLYTIDGATKFGNDTELVYASGDTVVATITPIYTDSPYVVESKTVSFTMI